MTDSYSEVNMAHSDDGHEDAGEGPSNQMSREAYFQRCAGTRISGRRSTSIVTPRELKVPPGSRNRSVMSEMLPDSGRGFLPHIRRSSMGSSLYSPSTDCSSSLSGPSTGFSSPAKLVHLPKLLLRDIQPNFFDMQDEFEFNRSMRFPVLDSSPTDCRLNLVSQKLQEDRQENAVKVDQKDTERDARPKRKRRKNKKKSEQKQKTIDSDVNQ